MDASARYIRPLAIATPADEQALFVVTIAEAMMVGTPFEVVDARGN
jgi:hypothetical protein